MVIEVKEFLVNQRYDTNSSISIDETSYTVLECNQVVLPKHLTKSLTFVVRCVQTSLIERFNNGSIT